MSQATETLDLSAEYDRIDTKLDDIADDVADRSEDNPARSHTVERGQTLERHLAGLEWALHPSDDEDRQPYEEVTIEELSAGEHADIKDIIAGDTDPAKGSAGSQELLVAAKGLVDAPFLPSDPSETQVVTAVNDLTPHFAAFLADRVDDLTTPDIQGNGFEQRVAERMSTQESR
ncbi:hypothetical protein [Halobacterium sp. BOL4-2]|uniref:hypothetical protein n=1 Tax=Halobacterium sp. BOL4-2 TaxID=2810537 RepID=UPI001966C468|nr:hypothetical protein [Halobacterium sp. BOL4-2]QRY26358.1 hypothetical protein JRZ79_13280 [Halobacterium sp. BOL4-2]